MVYSFDVFDTLITRTTYQPNGIFIIMQEKLSSIFGKKYPYLTEEFTVLRIQAERMARTHSKEEITLNDIYDELCRMAYFEEEDRAALMNMELETEVRNSIGIQQNINRFRQLKEHGEKVILISDMYLDSQDIRKILVGIDIIFEDIPIYVSSEYQETKRTGNLFFRVKDQEGILFSEWTHYGDNYQSDFLMPRLLGIKACLAETPNLMPWEANLLNQYPLKINLITQLELGTTRNLRRARTMPDAMKIGASFGGMFLFPYVSWIIEECRLRDITRLYFIARDGFLLKAIADKIISFRTIQIETKYIYGSRDAWRLEAAEKEKRDRAVKYLFQEMDLRDNHFAFVDLRGTGCTLEYVYQLLQERKADVMVQAFYYAMLNRKEHENCIFYTYSAEQQKSGATECLCRAPHGVTEGYCYENGIVSPVVREVDDVVWEKCGLYDYIQGVLLFTESLSDSISRVRRVEDGLANAEFLLNYMEEKPDDMLSGFLGEMPHSNSNCEDAGVYAPKLKNKEIIQLFWQGKTRSDAYAGGNILLSMKRMDDKQKKMAHLLQTVRKNTSVIHKYVEKRNGNVPVRLSQKHDLIIYGAGKYGETFYKEIKKELGGNVTAWVDADYEKYIKQGLPVESLQTALEKEFDYLVIAIGNSKVVQEIRNILLRLGVSQSKVIEVNNYRKKYYVYRKGK